MRGIIPEKWKKCYIIKEEETLSIGKYQSQIVKIPSKNQDEDEDIQNQHIDPDFGKQLQNYYKFYQISTNLNIMKVLYNNLDIGL